MLSGVTLFKSLEVSVANFIDEHAGFARSDIAEQQAYRAREDFPGAAISGFESMPHDTGSGNQAALLPD